MPVRSRSRASSSSRKASQLSGWRAARPVRRPAGAITPPSRISAAGLPATPRTADRARFGGGAARSAAESNKPWRLLDKRQQLLFCSAHGAAPPARAGAPHERDARRDALNVAGALSSARSLPQAAPAQRAMADRRALACARSRAGASSQPQPAAAHAGHAGVQQRQQRGASAAQGLHQLRVAARLRQSISSPFAAPPPGAHVRQRRGPACSALGQQRGGGGGVGGGSPRRSRRPGWRPAAAPALRRPSGASNWKAGGG